MATATAAAPTLVSPPTGGFPRELRLTADGHTLLVTNFFSRTVELVDWNRVRLHLDTGTAIQVPTGRPRQCTALGFFRRALMLT